jgi:hypothetical protein
MGDLISRNELIEDLEAAKDNGGMGYVIAATLIRYVKRCTTVDKEKCGHWIHCKGKSNLWYCSECGEKILYNQTRRTYNIEKRPVYVVNKYCRNCGARMTKDGDT